MEKYEKELVEDYISEKLKEIGWKFIPAGELERVSIKEPLLVENFKQSILRINRNLNAGEEEINKVINEIKLLPAGQEGIKKFLYFLKYGIGIKFEKEKVVKYISLIDYENLQNNEFIFSRQVHFKGKELFIPDIVLYVNGIPILEVECKNPLSLRTTWEDGYYQIKNYEKIFPELYKYIQIGISFADRVRYFPIVAWDEEVYKYVWKKDNLPEDESIFEFLSPSVITDIIKNFLFVREEHNEVKKVICRYMQYRAVNKIFKRVIGNLKGREIKNKGLIWHWQGSGKTLTMIFATHKLYFHPLLEKPTIFIIVDRRELEEQMKLELSSLKLNFDFEEVESVKNLKDILSYDEYKGKRGVFLTLIHKFRPDEKFLPEGINNSVSERKNIICFLDEVHRSQYGLLASQMKNVLKSAFFFGFTGTPIAEDERNTYVEFGYPLKEEGYLDKYFLDDSQRDGFTLPLVYLPRLEKEVHIKEKDIKFFIEKIESEDISEVEKEKINANVRKKLNIINVILENEKRISLISKDISDHFKENVDGKFKGMVVCGSRKACALYKKHLDRFLPENYSEVVMTFNQREKKAVIRNFYELWQKRYKKFPSDEERIKHIVENYKEKEYPKILIVTDMLITGFDVPILQTMYLDKLLKKHRLLQAIARTNRPYNDIKPFGLIVDYAGIFSYLNYALGEYYKGEVEWSVINYSSVLEEFEKILKNMEKIFEGIEFEIKRETLKKVIEILRDERKETEFVENYKRGRKLFEILASSSEKLKYFEKFRFFTGIYEYWKKIKNEKEKEKVEKVFKKTLSVIHQNIQFNNLIKTIPEIPIDINYLERIKNSSLSKEEKSVNILFALEKLILVEKRNNPVYRSIIDRVGELIKRWKERKIDYQSLWEEEEEINKILEEREKKRKELSLSEFEFGLFIILKEFLKRNDDRIKEIVKGIENLIKDDLIENWRENISLRKNIERKTREYLLEVKQKEKLNYDEFNLLHKKIMEYINDYAD